MYPTRAVRHAAWDALDFLFPVSFYLIVPFQLQLPQIITGIYCGFYVHLPHHTLRAPNIKYWHKSVAVEI